MTSTHQTSERHGPAGLPVPRLSFEEFLAFGREALIRADVPVVITLPEDSRSLGRAGLAERLGSMMVTLFTEPSDRKHELGRTFREIPLRQFLEDDRYWTDPGTWYRIVSNIRDSPADINAVLGFDAEELFDYRRALNAANLWVSHRGVFTQSHFDELENFNIALEGRKRLVLAPPGFWEYYPRSVLRGAGDKSQVSDFDDVDRTRFPKVTARLAERREIFLEAGQMLYIPLGWWHQAESLADVNININFWLRDTKIFRRPWVLGVALYTLVFRKLKGVYNYEPAKANAEGTS